MVVQPCFIPFILNKTSKINIVKKYVEKGVCEGNLTSPVNLPYPVFPGIFSFGFYRGDKS